MVMAQLRSSATCASCATRPFSVVLLRNPNPNLSSVFFQEKCRLRPGRVFCFFSDARKKEEARRALENALSQKKDEFEKWNKQIEKRVQVQQRGGGGGTGRGGWFGGGGWYGWFEGDGIWDKATQALLLLFGIGSLYLLVAKGEAASSVIFNSLLGVLRKIRETLDQLFSGTPQSGRVPVPVPVSETVNSSYQTPTSAKERVIRKWGMD